MPNQYRVIGVMSGTSLDGLDLACCDLAYRRGVWRFDLVCAATILYASGWKARLAGAHRLAGVDLIALDYAYGEWIGKACRKFVKNHGITNPQLIASHGHTVIHQPQRAITFQLGAAAAIHAAAGLPVVNDFRSLDVRRGGQGAPLVPLGDALLFGQYAACLNLGGIANISFELHGQRCAYDICFANMGLNYLAAQVGKAYDRGGAMAARGSIHPPLLDTLQALCSSDGRRLSLAREGFEQGAQRALDSAEISLSDKLRTFCEYISCQIAAAFPYKTPASRQMLVTGGGAFNMFLIGLLREKLAQRTALSIPSPNLVAFKEALIFALLGALRVREEINVLRSVTGARQDSVAGCVVGVLPDHCHAARSRKER